MVRSKMRVDERMISSGQDGILNNALRNNINSVVRTRSSVFGNELKMNTRFFVQKPCDWILCRIYIIYVLCNNKIDEIRSKIMAESEK